MTANLPERPADHHPAPPPGCPAHGGAPGNLYRLHDPEVQAELVAVYEKLRAEYGPVAPVLVQGDLPAWLVLGHRENLEILRTPSVFSRDSRHWRDMAEGNVPADHPLTPVTTWQPLCVFVDGEEHRRLRGAVTDSLGRFESRGIRRHVTRFTDQLIDEFAGSGTADLVGQFAAEIPLRVMTQLFGMPEEHGPGLTAAVQDVLKGTKTAAASNTHLTRTLQQLVERKRARPGHDFPSKLIEHPAGLTDDEIREHLRLILTAANETTVNLIANTLCTVLTDPRFRAHLTGGHMTLPDALEQVMWDEPPLMTLLGRWATSDTRLGEQTIRKGDMLLLGLRAANVDPAIRPDLTAPVHGNRSHLAFSGGPHECPGRHIGRAIADTAVDTLLTRLPDLRLAVPETELEWSSSLMYRHLVALPVQFTPNGR
ncbi:putative cytochrome P450 [Streptomyces sp. NBRC 110611]|uniref:cytochrome P450 n=1 Tax=Streptomyces sp. NBRC 110611 TaxID=1621259 RepID=UPI0008555FFB|nr:cytochrome P450 [Streptomyces sp. NBRC 110611]GAU71170.1 putative cytochrome P450 [Streptomyces sp. NBRC 110611]